MHFVLPAKTLPEWYQPFDETTPDWYRLTSTGMGEVATAMCYADMLDEDCECPELPEWPPPRLCTGRVKELGHLAGMRRCCRSFNRTSGRLSKPRLKKWQSATGQVSTEPGKVPWYKFQTNDGLLATPDECRSIDEGLVRALEDRDWLEEILRGLEEQGYDRTEETIGDLLRPWASYNRVAAQHGGYRIW